LRWVEAHAPFRNGGDRVGGRARKRLGGHALSFSFTFLDKTCLGARIVAEQQDVLFSLTLKEAVVSMLDF
jgi:hypothetical protein